MFSQVSSPVASFVLKIQHIEFLAFHPTSHEHSASDKVFSYAEKDSPCDFLAVWTVKALEGKLM